MWLSGCMCVHLQHTSRPLKPQVCFFSHSVFLHSKSPFWQELTQAVIFRSCDCIMQVYVQGHFLYICINWSILNNENKSVFTLSYWHLMCQKTNKKTTTFFNQRKRKKRWLVMSAQITELFIAASFSHKESMYSCFLKNVQIIYTDNVS